MRYRPYLATIIGFVVVGAALLPFLGCSAAPNLWEHAKPGQKRILVSFPPLYALTAPIAEPDAAVLCMLTTQGPHDYEGHQNDIFMVNGADLLIYNGLTLDDVFVGKMLRASRNKKLQKFNIGEALRTQNRVKKGRVLPGHEDHGHGEFDPHVWLGPVQAIAMARLITEKLGELDPDNKKKYETRRDELITKLEKLHADGKKALAGKTNRSIMPQHESLLYFADKEDGFDLVLKSPIQIKPGVDPEAVWLTQLIKMCQAEKVALIAVEPQYSTARAEALQLALKNKGANIRIATIDPLETSPALAGTRNPDPNYYFDKMRANIDTLVKSLP